MEESVSSIIHYEVYVYQSGAWDLLGRYPSEQRAKAIEYARSIENSEHKPTKVVRETYDLDTQTFLEALVYLSEIPKPQPRKSSPYENSVIPTTIKRDNQKKSNLTEGVVMIFMSIVFSMMTAGVVTAVILRVMSSVGFTAQDISGQFVLECLRSFSWRFPFRQPSNGSTGTICWEKTKKIRKTRRPYILRPRTISSIPNANCTK